MRSLVPGHRLAIYAAAAAGILALTVWGAATIHSVVVRATAPNVEPRGGTTPALAPSAVSRPATVRRPADPDRGADPLSAAPLGTVVESAHYRVSTDADVARSGTPPVSVFSSKVAEDAAALLERAWPIWCRRFGLDPAYDAGPGRFSVRIYATAEQFQKDRFREAGFSGPCLGFVDFRGFRLFALHQADAYEMRRVLLHEGAHQFLYRLIGTSAAEKLPRWYDEGCAHESEKHVLDGDRLDLFQHTGGAFSYQIGDALNAFKEGRILRTSLEARLIPFDEGRFRSCGWAVVHFMRFGGDSRQADWFKRWEAEILSGSRERIPELLAEFGDTVELTKRLVGFLEEIVPKAASRK